MTDVSINDRAWVATKKGLFELRRRGSAWAIEQVSFLGEPVSIFLPPANGGARMLASLTTGHYGTKVWASDDAGHAWSEVAAPTYPKQPESAEGPEWKLVLIWALERAHGSLWAGTLPGGLFRSDDDGASWHLIESLWNRKERLGWFGGGYAVPGIHSICAHPRRSGEMLLGISCGGAWTTRDGGANWDLTAKGMRANFMPPEMADDGNIQDAHRIVRCAAAPDVLWCQHHGGIWRSTDNAASWHEITTAPVSNFGFAVAVHPRDPDTAWFAPAEADQKRVPVGAAMVVNRTRDGGNTFETLRSGLPQEHAYDLVYRHGLAVAEDGQTLLMTSTSGGLWASGDGGDHWQTVSTSLPPAVAVRFG
jgi:photosystem II stability/assembly factor-like uncharacterized protein